MGGLRSVAWRGLVRRKARSILTMLAVMLGVANVVGVFVVNQTIDRGIEARTTFLFEGGADAEARREEAGHSFITRDELFALRKLDGVEAAVPVMYAWDSIQPERGNDLTYIVSGIDEIGRDVLLEHQLVEGRLFEPGRPEMVISRTASRELRLGVGDQWRTDLRDWGQEPGARNQRLGIVKGAARVHRLAITGVVEDPVALDPSTSWGSWMSLEYAWQVFEPDFFGSVRFYLEDGEDPGAWTSAAEAAFTDLRFQPSGLAPEFRRFVQTIKGMLAGTSALALFVGAFLIYLTFSIAVVERTRLYGSLHAIGARSRQVASAVFVEALIIGGISTVLGIVFGYVLSGGLVRLVASVVPIPVAGSPRITPAAVIGGVAVGIIATAAGAVVPAVRAARLSPVDAIRGPSVTSPRISSTWIVGAVLFVLGFAYVATAELATDALSTIATMAVLAGSVLLVPPVLGPVARSLRRIASRFSPGLGQVAVMHVIREPGRSAYMLALVMVVLSAILTLGTTNRSLQQVADTWVDKRFGADLLLYGPDITEKVEDDIRNVRGVAGVTTTDFNGRVRILKPSQSASNLVLIDPGSFFAIAGFPWADGNDEQARNALERGGSVLLPSRLAHDLGVGRGDRVTLSRAQDQRSFQVAGVYATLAQGPEVGVVASFVDDAFFRPDQTRDAIYINYEPGARPDTMAIRLQNLLAPELGKTARGTTSMSVSDGPGTQIGAYFAITGLEIKERARRDLAGFFRLFAVVILIAAIVGVLGMANTLAATVLMRFREIGILQALGARPKDVRRMIVAEASVLVAVACLLSLFLGTLLAWMFNRGAGSEAGFSVPLQIPWALLPALAVLALLIGLIAAVAPARRAQQLTPVEALRYE